MATFIRDPHYELVERDGTTTCDPFIRLGYQCGWCGTKQKYHDRINCGLADCPLMTRERKARAMKEEKCAVLVIPKRDPNESEEDFNRRFLEFVGAVLGQICSSLGAAVEKQKDPRLDQMQQYQWFE